MKHVVIIGGGVAGLEASVRLSELGFSVSIVEQSNELGGKLNRWDRLFPDQQPAAELLESIQQRFNSQITSLVNTQVLSIQKKDHQFELTLDNNKTLKGDAILISTGFETFNARRKEEYGYGIYDNVVTSADLEKIFRDGEELRTSNGKVPERIGIIHCVGSRDEKAGNTYCSQVCCITAVKQAIEIKEKLPDAEVFCFYMDLRMFGRNFEDLYKKAQMEYNVQFIRGRLSEASENTNGSVILKVEDTLLGKPLKLNVDMVVLMVGMEPVASAKQLGEQLNLKIGTDGFFNPSDSHYHTTFSEVPGVFLAGACTGPKTMENTLNEARAAALAISAYLKN
jgi:heterodisulfide reductase subunit A2